METKTRNRALGVLSAGVLAASSLALSGAVDEAHAAKEGHEKCYGVAKAGQNDCGSADGSHGCSGKAATDADPNEWLYVPDGLCEKLAGGSTTPPSGD